MAKRRHENNILSFFQSKFIRESLLVVEKGEKNAKNLLIQIETSFKVWFDSNKVKVISKLILGKLKVNLKLYFFTLVQLPEHFYVRLKTIS